MGQTLNLINLVNTNSFLMWTILKHFGAKCAILVALGDKHHNFSMEMAPFDDKTLWSKTAGEINSAERLIELSSVEGNAIRQKSPSKITYNAF